ncbi:D-aminoacyl-tRNA deacylase, partial [Escherichia coli]
SAAPPAQGETVFEHLVKLAREAYPQVATGRFGADMQVHLVNDGPVTFLLESAAPPAQGETVFEHLVKLAREAYPQVATGRFGA